MKITPIYDKKIKRNPMNVAAFMSGSGTNIKKLLEKEQSLKVQYKRLSYEVKFIFSDRSDGICQGEKIAQTYGIPYFSYDIRAFHKKRGIKRSVRSEEGMIARKEFDTLAAQLVKTFNIDVIALGGYMSFLTLNRCVNVHPADLSIQTFDGKRKYVGDHAVYDAILAGEKSLRSSTLWTDQGVDTGPLLMVSESLPVTLTEPLESLKKNRGKLLEIVNNHQEHLKRIGDWKIFSRTIELIAEGRFELNEQGDVYLDGKPIPYGFRE